MKAYVALLYLLPLSLSLPAQRTEILSPDIRTLQVQVGDDWNRLPVLTLGGKEQLHYSFDAMTHEYRRYTYRVEHCGADFQPSEALFESDYLQTAENYVPIDDYEPSRNTVSQYTHYRFDIPSADLRPLLSGNYRLTVYLDDGNDEGRPVLQTYFYVSEESAPFSASVSGNTDLDWNARHQQLSLRVNYGGMRVRNAREDIKLRILQNRDQLQPVVNPAPTFDSGSELIWEHCRELIFPASNEYRKFELLSTRYPTLHVDSIRWDGRDYHAYLLTDEPRHNYLYDEDRNGAFVVRTDNEYDPDEEAEYVRMHFSLAAPQPYSGDVYVDGLWTYGNYDETTRMRYDAQRQVYEKDILLKQGYYNYRYRVPSERYNPVEGDFYQTENEYAVFVYCRRPSDRYDRLVGFRSLGYRPR